MSFKAFLKEAKAKTEADHHKEHLKWKGHIMMCPYCEKRTRYFEHRGATTSDAQGFAEAEHLNAQRGTKSSV